MKLLRTILGYVLILIDIILVYEIWINGKAPNEVSYNISSIALLSHILTVAWIVNKSQKEGRIYLSWALISLIFPYWPLLWYDNTSKKIERYIFWGFSAILVVLILVTSLM